MDTETNRSELEKHSFFHGLREQDLATLASVGTVKDLRPEEVLFRQDSPAEHFFLVLAGSVSVQVPALYGAPLIMHEVGAGDVLGWSWLFPPYRWHFEARGKESGRTMAFDARTVRDCCEKDHDFGYEIVKRFATLMKGRLEAARRQVMETYSPYG